MIELSSRTNDIALICDESAVWSILVKGENLALSLGDHGVLLSLLPFLEIGKVDLLRKIHDPDAEYSFPELVFIEAGLRHSSDYWVSCALGWLKDCSVGDVKKFNSYLFDISGNKEKYKQSVRHQAKSLLKLAAT